MKPSRVNPDLEVLFAELTDLPEQAEGWDPERVNDEQDAYESEWASYALGRINDLERAHTSGAVSPEQERRYAEVKALFRDRMPFIERYGLDKPAVPPEG